MKFIPLNQTYKYFNYLSDLLFTEGWFFFIPYLLFYLIFKYFKLDISNLQVIFIVLHILNLILFIYYIYNNKHKTKVIDVFFWLILAFVFLRYKAYLEFPSDPWEHFRRIFSWSHYSLIDDNFSSKNKFTYFWGWTIMSNVQPLFRRIIIDFYSAFWQLLLAYQFYLFSLCLGFDKKWAKIQVIGTIFLFGTNLFGFYRYYALSSTHLAYIAYLRALIILMQFNKKQIEQLALLIPLTFMMLYNHVQEFLLFSVSCTALFLSYILDIKNYQKNIYFGLSTIIIVGFVIGTYIINNPQVILGNFKYDFGLPYVSQWGTFRIWDPKLSYWETFGIHGLVSLALAIYFFERHRKISLLTITPYLLMLFPPFVIFFSTTQPTLDNYVTYRALYAFPTSFMLILGLKEAISLLIQKFNFSSSKFQLLLSVIIVISIIAIPPSYPYRGRFWFQIYRPPVELSLTYTDVTAQWFFENSSLDLSCLLFTDTATQFMIATHLGLTMSDRLSSSNLSHNLNSKEELTAYIEAKHGCSLLITDSQKVMPIPTSIVAQLSGHWNPNIVKENLSIDPKFERIADSLLTIGWSKTVVPPFYLLYEKNI